MDTGMETRIGPLGAIKGIFKGIINPVEYVDSTVRSGWGTTLLIMFIVSLLVPFLTFSSCRHIVRGRQAGYRAGADPSGV